MKVPGHGLRDKTHHPFTLGGNVSPNVQSDHRIQETLDIAMLASNNALTTQNSFSKFTQPELSKAPESIQNWPIVNSVGSCAHESQFAASSERYSKNKRASFTMGASQHN